MNCGCHLSGAAYRTGKISNTEKYLSHPGGLSLTLRGLDLAGLPPGATVLDLGCGSGASMRLLHSLGLKVIGLDPSAGENDQGNVTRIQGHAEKIPVASCSIDGVLAECSLSVMEDQERVLQECARVSRPGGHLILSDLYAREPQAISCVRALDKSCISGMIVRDELEALLAANGFSLNVWEDHSPALREFVARLIMDYGTLAMLWHCDGSETSAEEIHSAMRAVRAGYFLLVATRNREQGEHHE